MACQHYFAFIVVVGASSLGAAELNANNTSMTSPALRGSMATILSGNATLATQMQNNFVTMWTKDADTASISASSCFGQHVGFKPVLPVLRSCAVSEDLYQSGVACGKCYFLHYGGTPSVYDATTSGTPGSAKVQVIDDGAGGTNHFDCLEGVFTQLTGLATDGFPITFTEVEC